MGYIVMALQCQGLLKQHDAVLYAKILTLMRTVDAAMWRSTEELGALLLDLRFADGRGFPF